MRIQVTDTCGGGLGGGEAEFGIHYRAVCCGL